MLFDLTNPRRKRVVRVVFGALAVVFAGSFVFLGIGSETGGGLADVFGGGNQDAAADQFEQQIEDAEKRLEADPEASDALAELALLRYQSGEAQLEIDEETGTPTGLSDDSRQEFESAIATWERYIATDPKEVDQTTAIRVVQAYRFLNDPSGAADAQRELIKTDPSALNYASLADILYRDLEIKAADKARDQALEKASKQQANALERQLGQIRKLAVAQQKAEEQAPDAGQGGDLGLGDPFGGAGALPGEPTQPASP